jgi:tetratricopeptide (TPR) repeat protein
MTFFQLILFISAMVIFYLFFKKLFSEDYPKRGVDFEARHSDEPIGGVSSPDKIFSRPSAKPSRLEQLIVIADESVQKDDLAEAKKALQSALIVDGENPDVLSRYGYILNAMGDFAGAKESYLKVLQSNPSDDMTHGALANVLHKLEDDEDALVHHRRSVELDPGYAPHYFNFANTLNDLGRKSEALELYKKAYEIDPEITEAKEMIAKLDGVSAHD